MRVRYILSLLRAARRLPRRTDRRLERLRARAAEPRRLAGDARSRDQLGLPTVRPADLRALSAAADLSHRVGAGARPDRARRLLQQPARWGHPLIQPADRRAIRGVVADDHRRFAQPPAGSLPPLLRAG